MPIQAATSYTRPGKGTLTERVWTLADQITARKGIKARRGEVIEAFVTEGGNANTAATQYHYWSQQYDPAADERSDARPVPVASTLRVDSAGRLVIPAEIRDAMQIGADGVLHATLENGELRLITPRKALDRAKAIVRKYVQPGVSVVDELIADRRAEAARENEP